MVRQVYTNLFAIICAASLQAAKICYVGEPSKDMNGKNVACNSSANCPIPYDCKKNVCCLTKQYVCALTKSFGNKCAQSAVTRYSYNTATKNCESFAFGGCGGNANNFETLFACINFCSQIEPIVKPTCAQGEPERDSTGNYVSCSSTKSCRVGYECKSQGFTAGCCPTKSYTCSLPFHTGTQCSLSSATRWAFSPASQTCQPFTYSGCDGNSNNFATQQQCNQYCRTTSTTKKSNNNNVCPNPDQTFIGTCVQGTCASGFTCINNGCCYIGNAG